MKVTDEMVSRFLGWTLPKTFAPDCGISFDKRPPDARGYPTGWPIGTNLFTADEARAMLEHVLVAAPPVQPQWVSVDRDFAWVNSEAHIPLVIFKFKPNDWEARDTFAAKFAPNPPARSATQQTQEE